MNTIITKIKAAISAIAQPIKGYYGRHRLIVLSGITILSILLIVWARAGFTLQFGQSSAINLGIVIRADKSEVDNNESFVVYGNFPIGSICQLSADTSALENKVVTIPDSPWSRLITHIDKTTKFTMKCPLLGEASVTVKLKSDTYTCLKNPAYECANTCAQPNNSIGTCPGAQFCCPKVPPIKVTLSATPTSAPYGGTVQLTWTSTNATTCTNAYGVFNTGNKTNGTTAGSLPYQGATTKFIVKCSDGSGNEALSNEVVINLTAAPSTAPPPTQAPTPTATITTTPAACNVTAPTALTNTSITATSVALSWTPGTGGTKQYLRLGTSLTDIQGGCPTGSTCLVKEDNLPTTQSSYQATGLSANTTYHWKVVTFKESGCYKETYLSFTSGSPVTSSPSPTTTQQEPTPTVSESPNVTLSPTITVTPIQQTLTCAPVSQTVNVGQAAYLSASGGDGSVYYWQADGQARTGSQVSFVFSTIGSKQVIVSSSSVNNGSVPQATCMVNVVTPTTTTGATVSTGPGDAVVMALLVSGIVTLLYVSYTHTSMFRRREIDSITRKRDPMDFRG